VNLTQARLKELLLYYPKTGSFVRLTGPKRGQVAGSAQSGGYIQIRIEGVLYVAQRLAWLYMTGKWPEHDIDHRNRKRSDNRWRNLRPADDQTQTYNRSIRRTQRVPVVGIYLTKGGKFAANISVSGQRIFLGVFDTLEEAKTKRGFAEAVHHGEYGSQA
jgi:hypothetical protein